ncbi:MAG: universal stress protein [Candidatus Thorarchaeota archaeon]|nr:universal stress protein [Candidatus Thorarchaeota archaeon]
METLRYCAPGHIFCRANKVLLAVDGSEGSAKAATVAFEVAEMTKSTLYIINVVPTSVAQQFSLISDSDLEEVLRKYEESGRTLLEGTKVAADEYNLEIELILEKGSPSERIILQAKDLGVDLIVIGSRGVASSLRSGVGSSAERVVLGSDCPVLVVK